jgi:hypothetical protein
MTPEFEKWIEISRKDESQDHWEFVDPLSQMTAKFWLTRIFAEIEREQAIAMTSFDDLEALDIAFKQIKAKFGLGGE